MKIENYFNIKNNFKKYEYVNSHLVFDNHIKVNCDLAIAIPTYNRLDTLREAFLSAVNQKTDYIYSIIIVDNDNSQNNKDSIIKLIKNQNVNLNIKYYINENNLGMFGNWNRCFELAETKWVALLHDDDLISDEYFQNVYHFLQNKNPELLSISHKFIDINSEVCYKDLFLTNRSIKLKNRHFKYIHPISNVATVYKRDTVLFEGGFNEDAFPISDFITNYQFVNKYNCYRILKCLGYYRIEGNESSNLLTIQKTIDMTYEVKKFLFNNIHISFIYRCQKILINDNKSINELRFFHLLKMFIGLFFRLNSLILLKQIHFKKLNK